MRRASSLILIGAISCGPASTKGVWDDAIVPWDVRDGTYCIDEGVVTFRNTIEPLLGEYCLKCHSPDAVSPQYTWGADHLDVDWEADGASSAYAVYYGFVYARDAYTGTSEEHQIMPPATESQPTEDEIELVRTWYEGTYDEGAEAWEVALGSALPTIEVVGASFSPFSGQLSVTYKGLDEDSEATVTVFLDDDDEGLDGQAIEGCLPESPGVCDATTHECLALEHTESVSVPDSIEAGSYYVYACIYDQETVWCDYLYTPLRVARLPIADVPVMTGGGL